MTLLPLPVENKTKDRNVPRGSLIQSWKLTFFTKIGRTYTIICLSGLSERNSAPRILISRKFHFLHHHVRFLIYFFRNLAPNSLVISKVLEPVCCKKQQKKVPDQLQVCGIGDLWRTWIIPNWLYMSPSDSTDHQGSIFIQNLPRSPIPKPVTGQEPFLLLLTANRL